MHPALSVIFFTTLTGLGYGLAIMLGLFQPDPSFLSTKLAHILAFGAISVGLLSSTLHLGNPQRFLRAFTQWRSSWLSREGVIAIITFLPLSAQTLDAVFFDHTRPWIGLLVAICSVITIYCTSMIYASLKTIDAWHTPLTTACYLAFAMSSGLLSFIVFAPTTGLSYAPLAILSVFAALFCKILWHRRLDSQPSTSTAETATGLGHLGEVRLLERPHMGDNYLTKEMVFQLGRKHALSLRKLSLLLTFVLPLVFIIMFMGTGFKAVIVLGLISHLCGLLVERWLFFAEAKHTVSLYYGG